MQASAILQLALALLPLVNTGVTEFIAFINSLRSSMQQTGEWTDVEETAWRTALYLKTQDPAYQPDP